jgi:hypothetical protein
VILLSLALVLASLGLLIGGLLATSQVLVWGSLVASLGACACLLVSVIARRRGMVDLDGDAGSAVPAVPLGMSPPGESVWTRPAQSWIPERPAIPDRSSRRVDADSISPPTTPIPIPTLPPAASPPAPLHPQPESSDRAATSPAAPPSPAATPPSPAATPSVPAAAAPAAPAPPAPVPPAPAPPAPAPPAPAPPAPAPPGPVPPAPVPPAPAPYHRRQPVTSSARPGAETDSPVPEPAGAPPPPAGQDLFTPGADAGPPKPRVTAEPAGAAAPESPFRAAPQEAALAGPPDEPPVEEIPVSVALRAAQLADEVLVVDQRPRYHLRSCPWLGERATLPLPLSIARRSGFTPCGVCRPDSTLIARARSTGRGSV